VTQDVAQARRWFRLAADQGFAIAQYNLGVMCMNGQGAPVDYAEALRWFLAAAEQQNASAQFSVGVFYERGRGVGQDHAEAVRWYRRAADRGDAAAQLNLGILYFHGRGIPQDYVESHKWLNLAASRFLPAEAEKRARAVKNRDIVAKHLTRWRLAEAQKLAREWVPAGGVAATR
jgi:TPR repeat protein